MTDRCPTKFDQTLLSGHLDRELTQGEGQRVRLHLEDCAACREELADLARLRQATRTTPFRPPEDDGWDERPRGLSSLLTRRLGWTMVLAWAAVILVFAVWQLATAPEDLGVKLLVASPTAGVVLLFLSVLLDRLRTYKTDRYRRVLK
jgi:predicted anti-sigma-YlaC factor YlaD